MNVSIVAQVEHVIDKFWVEGWFAAREGYAASAALIVGQIGQQHFEQIFWCHVLADKLKGAVRTRLDTGQTRIAFRIVNSKTVAVDGVLRADLQTIKGPAASIRMEGDQRFDILRLRILAPGAMQVAAFEENQGSDPGTVMNGKSLDVENRGGQLVHRLRGCLARSSDNLILHFRGQIDKKGTVP